MALSLYGTLIQYGDAPPGHWLCPVTVRWFAVQSPGMGWRWFDSSGPVLRFGGEEEKRHTSTLAALRVGVAGDAAQPQLTKPTMSRYSNSGSSNSGSSNNDEYDAKTLKLQNLAALRFEPTDVTTNSHQEYGTSFIINFDNTEVLDGVVFQREDSPSTWKVFSADKFFHLNQEDGLVYESARDGDYSGQMSAQDIIDAPRVAGFSESFGGTDYYYEPVCAIIEEADDIATGDVDVTVTEENTVEVGAASMLLGNKTWVRNFAQKVTESGSAIINDDGSAPDDPGDNPKYDQHEWLTTERPELRSSLNGRSLEMWVSEETATFDNGDTVTYDTANVIDRKTGENVVIQHDAGDGSDSGSTTAATDGGTRTDASGESGSLDEPTIDSGDLPAGVPDKLDDLIGYMARNGRTDVGEVRSFALDEVESPEDVDWDAVAAEAERRQ